MTSSICLGTIACDENNLAQPEGIIGGKAKFMLTLDIISYACVVFLNYRNNVFLEIWKREANEMKETHDTSLNKEKLFGIFLPGPFVHKVNP